MNLDLKILPAFNGDSIIISFGNNDNISRILIDAGPKRTYTKGCLKNEFEKNKQFDLLILTHIDEDHIGGILKYYEDEKRTKNLFLNIWFNSFEVIDNALGCKREKVHMTPIDSNLNGLNMSYKQGLSLENLIQDVEKIDLTVITSLQTHTINKATIQVLSPDIEDLKILLNEWELEVDENLNMSHKCDHSYPINFFRDLIFKEEGSKQNKSSIAFLFEYSDHRILLLGDSFSSIVEKNLRQLGYHEKNRIKVDITKLSHHGSKYGLSTSILNIIDCDAFIVSTDGKNCMPNKETLSRIILTSDCKKTLYFNYRSETINSIFSNEDKEKYNFEVKYLSENNDYTIKFGE